MDGVTGERVGVVDAHLVAPAGGPMVIEEGSG